MDQEKDVLNGKKISCIAFDLDRTLLRSDGSLSARTRQALELAAGRGIELAALSGRPFCALPDAVLSLSGLHYAAVSNGAAVYRIGSAAKAERIHSRTLEKEDVLWILRGMQARFESGEISYEVFVEGVSYAPKEYLESLEAYGFSVQAAEYTRSTRSPVENIISFIETNAGQLDSLDIILKDSAGKMALSKSLSREMPGIYVTSSMAHRIEISHRDASKAEGLRYILQELDLPAAETLAFGDGDNDADMLRFAGIGAAVKNAAPECLAAADLVCGSNDEDGVAQVIEKIPGSE